MKSFYEIREKTLTPEEDKAKEVRKQNPGFSQTKRDKDGKIAEATNQKLFMFKTEAEAKAHAKKNGGKVVKYSPTNYAVLDKDLAKKPGKKPDGMVKESELDEISMGKMAAYADKAVKSRNDAKARTYSADTHRVAKAGETIRKRKAGADNYNKKMWGYGNVAPTKESVDEGVYTDDLPDTRKKWKDPASVPRKISHSEIMKAIGNTQSSAQGMAILQKKFKLTAAQARKHMDMFLKDDVNEGAPYDSGWKDAKPVKKDKSGNVIKDKNVAKNLAKSAMKSFKDIRKK